MKIGKKFLILLVAASVIWGLERFCHQKTGGFTLLRVQSDLPYNPQWDTQAVDASKLEPIFKQKFTYFNRGVQSYAFISDDGKYVLKLFQHYRMRLPYWASLVPNSFLKAKTAKRAALLKHDFDSYKIAFDVLKEETGLIYVHLNKTGHQLPKLTIVDKIGIKHEIDLDQMEFLIQNRAALVHNVLDELMARGEKEKAEQSIDELLHLILRRCQKGIFDKDPDFATNFGFFDGHAMQVDVGRFEPDESMRRPGVYKINLIHATDPFKKWLQGHHPLLAEYLDSRVRRITRLIDTKESLTRIFRKTISSDIALKTKFGFLGDDPIDIKALVFTKDIPFKKQLALIAEPYRTCLEQNQPELSNLFESELTNILDEE